MKNYNSWKALFLIPACIIALLGFSWAEESDWGFQLVCPHDVWIDCDDQIEDLDAYGEAYIEHNYHTYPAPHPEVHYHLDDCGGGYIKRTWKVTGPYGGWYKCSQKIYIKSGGNFNEHDIVWPHDYVLHDCFDNTDPEDLPHGFDKPKINEEECAEIFYNYSDWVFTPPGGGSCGKILRKWKVINWCEYHPNDYHPKGLWEHTQVIKIKGSHDFHLNCPDELTISAGVNCAADVNIPKATVTGECPEGVHITNDSPYAFNNGADASGNYPVGTTEVCFTATDGCGNEDKCCTWITVEDQKKPTPVCHSGIVVTLGLEVDGYYRVCPPYVFDKGSFDNCTDKEDLKLRLEPNTFTCADLGVNDIRLYVVDESGNENFCNTTIIVQDNMGMCPDPDSLTINGSVYTMGGQNVDNVSVNNVTSQSAVMTDEEGMYSVSNLLASEGYTLVPHKNDAPKEALDMQDLVVMSEYLFGDDPMDDPYLMIAADIDNNQDVDLQDFLKLRGLLLDDYQHFSDFSDQTSWRFVNSDFIFDSAQEPWVFEAEKEFEVLGESQHNQNFIGVKIGDLNHSYKYTLEAETAEENQSLTSLESRSVTSQWTWNDAQINSNQSHTLRIPMDSWGSWKGIDATFDLKGVSVVEATSSNSDIIVRSTKDQLRIFGVATETEFQNEYVEITLTSQQTRNISESVALKSAKVLNAEEALSLELSWRSQGELATTSGLTILPNPMADKATVSFTLAEEGEYNMTVIDNQGITVYGATYQGNQGRNQVVLDRQSIGRYGIYWLQINSGVQQMTSKLMIVR